MKKIISSLLVAVITFAIAGCNQKIDQPSNTSEEIISNDVNVQTYEPTDDAISSSTTTIMSQSTTTTLSSAKEDTDKPVDENKHTSGAVSM